MTRILSPPVGLCLCCGHTDWETITQDTVKCTSCKTHFFARDIDSTATPDSNVGPPMPHEGNRAQRRAERKARRP